MKNIRVEYGEHCFGSYLNIDGKDYKEITIDERIEFINKFLKDEFINYEVLKTIVEWAEGEEKTTSDTCEQCGHYCIDNKKVIKRY